MTNPTIVQCPKGVWTKVAAAVTTAAIHRYKYKLQVGKVRYLQTARDTGEATPTDDSDAIIFEGQSLFVNNSTQWDIYIKATNKNGYVRVEV